MAWANGRVGAASGDRRCSLVTGLSTNRIMASAALSPHLAKEIATLAILFLPTEPLAQAVLRVPMSPEDLLGRDGSPSGPAPQTWRFRRNRPTWGADPGNPIQDDAVEPLVKSVDRASCRLNQGRTTVSNTPWANLTANPRVLNSQRRAVAVCSHEFLVVQIDSGRDAPDLRIQRCGGPGIFPGLRPV